MSGIHFSLSRHRAPVLLCLAAAVAGTGLGWLGRSVRSRASSRASSGGSASTSESANSLSSGDRQRRETAPGSPRPLSTSITSGLARNKGVDYWLFLLGGAENASPSVLAKLLDSILCEPAATRLLGTRWAQLDPAGMFAMLKSHTSKKGEFSTDSPAGTLSGELQKILAAEWLQQDPEALIRALGGTESQAQMKTAKAEVLRLLVTTNPGRTVGLMLDWHMPMDSADGDALVSWIQANPRQSAEQLLRKKQFGTGGNMDDRSLFLNETAKAMARTDPAGAMRMDPAAVSALRYDFQQLVLKEWARHDLPGAVAYLSGGALNLKQKNEWSGPILEAWGGSDPAAALDWAVSHLSGTSRARAGGGLIKTVASSDPDRALEILERLPSGWTRDQSVGTIAETVLQGKEKPAVLEGMQWMTSVPDPFLRDSLLAAAAGKLMTTAPEEFLAWLKTPEGSQASFGVLQATARRMRDANGAAAMEWVAGLRPEAVEPVRDKVLGDWLFEKPALAGAWVRDLSAGPQRALSVAQAASLMPYGDGMNNETFTAWLDSLPASDHPAILEGLRKSGGLNEAIKTQLLQKYK